MNKNKNNIQNKINKYMTNDLDLDFSDKEYVNSLKYFNFYNDKKSESQKDLHQYYMDLSPKENLKLLINKEISKKHSNFQNPKVSIFLNLI